MIFGRLLFAGLLFIAGCAGGPEVAGWQINASQGLQAFERLYLAGDTRGAEAEFQRAKAELASTGRGDLLARAELVRCAARIASLELDDCPGFAALRDVAGKEELAYADYLAGKGTHKAEGDALSRLVGFGVSFRKTNVNPADIAAAVELASAQGWRRPLLAWLGVQAKSAEAAGDSETAGRVRRRMDLISK